MRAIWKGHINFALVSIPVTVFSATRSSDISLKYLHKKDLSPVSYKRFCDREGTEVEWEDITRGYEFEKGRFVEVTRDELSQANASLTRSIQIVEFVDVGEIDPVYFDKPYYLEPQPGGEHAYSLLVEALAQSEKVGIARVVLKTREHLAAIRPAGRMMTMQTLRFAHELSEAGSIKLPEDSQTSPKEIDLANTLIETMCGTFEPGKYKDEYRAELLEVIRKKVSGEGMTGIGTGPAEPAAQVVDLMEVLKQSLSSGKRTRSSSPIAREKTVVAGRTSKKKGRARTRKTG